MIKLATLAMMALGLATCHKVPPYDGEYHQKQAMMNKKFESFTHDIKGQALHGVHAGEACNPAIIFIHGTPGDWKAWGRYLGDEELGRKAFMIAVDRPGFAGSDGGIPETQFKKQALAIITAAQKEHKGPFLLVGHSYGGPIQMQIALDFPNAVSGMIVLAGAIDPVLQTSRWYHYAGNTWLARNLLPQALNVATKEMLSLPDELANQRAKLKDVTAHTTIIQGSKDWLVPPGNTAYARKQLRNAPLEIIDLPKQGHFIPWEQYDLVKSTILKNLPEGQCL